MSNPMQGGPGGPYQPGAPYQPPGQSAPPAKSGMSVLWIVLIVLGVLALGCICCAGLSYWGFNTGMGQIAEGIVQESQDNPEVVEKIGSFTAADLSFNFIASGEKGEGKLVFDVNGSKGSGQFVVPQPQDSGGRVTFSSIILESGGESITVK